MVRAFSSDQLEERVGCLCAARKCFFENRNPAHVRVRENYPAVRLLHLFSCFAPDESGNGPNHPMTPDPDIDVPNVGVDAWMKTIQISDDQLAPIGVRADKRALPFLGRRRGIERPVVRDHSLVRNRMHILMRSHDVA